MKLYFICVKWDTDMPSCLGGCNTYTDNFFVKLDMRSKTSRSSVNEAIISQTNIGEYKGLVKRSITVLMMTPCD